MKRLMVSDLDCRLLNERGISKFRALKKYYKKVGMDVSDVIAFGYAFNDYKMLKNVGHPC